MKFFVLAIVIAFLCMTVKQYKPEYTLVCQLCGVIIIFIYILSLFEDIISPLEDMISSSGIDISFFEILLKALAISVLSDISASICRDSGNNTLAKTVDLFGKTMIIVISLPILKKLADAVMGFLN